MTIDQFKQKLNKPEKFDDLLNYLVCIFFIGFGLWILMDLIKNGFYHPEMGNKKYLILFFPFGFIFIGIYGMWRIPKDYQIGHLNSLKPIEKKIEIINGYFSQLKIVSKKEINNHIECIYKDNILNTLSINIYFDEEKVLFNIRSFDSFNKGFIDFGFSKRATRKLNEYLTDRL